MHICVLVYTHLYLCIPACVQLFMYTLMYAWYTCVYLCMLICTIMRGGQQVSPQYLCHTPWHNPYTIGCVVARTTNTSLVSKCPHVCNVTLINLELLCILLYTWKLMYAHIYLVCTRVYHCMWYTCKAVFVTLLKSSHIDTKLELTDSLNLFSELSCSQQPSNH